MNFINTINPNLIGVLGVIYALLLTAECIVYLLKKAKPQSDFKELFLRVRSWWVMTFIFSLALLISKNLSLFFLGLISFLALKEYFSMIPTRRSDRKVLLWAYLTVPLQYTLAGMGWYGMFIIFIPVYMFLLIPCRMLIAGETKNFLHAIGTIHWGLMTTVYCLSHAAYLLSMPQHPQFPSGNAGVLLFLVVLTQLNDVAQYFWGKLFGKEQIVPTISPGKTIAGFFGGVLTTVMIAIALAPILTPFDILHAAIVGSLLGICGFVGDINISAVKRDVGLKDTGQLIPGHGGILDRVDSLTFTAPIFFHYLNYFYF